VKLLFDFAEVENESENDNSPIISLNSPFKDNDEGFTQVS
jgi:hypothetical protein